MSVDAFSQDGNLTNEGSGQRIEVRPASARLLIVLHGTLLTTKIAIA